MSICAVTCNARGSANFIDAQSMRSNPVVSGQVHSVRTFWFWCLHLMALIAIPGNAFVLGVRIAMARRTLQTAMSLGGLVRLAFVESEGLVGCLTYVAAFIQDV